MNKRVNLLAAALLTVLASPPSANPGPAPAGQTDLVRAALDYSAGPESRCAALERLGELSSAEASEAVVAAVSDPDPAVQACAARAAGASRNQEAVNALLTNVGVYLAGSSAKGPYEDDLRARLKAIDSIWALGEIGSPSVMAKLREFYSAADAVLRVNLAISVGKLGPNPHSVPYLRSIAASAAEAGAVRAAAFEMLEERGETAAVPGLAASAPGIEPGDLVYTGGIVGSVGSFGTSDLPIGHAGIFLGTEVRNNRLYVLIADCVPDNFEPYGGVRNIDSWKNFTHHFKFPYYGNRTTRRAPTQAQRQAIVRLARDMGGRGLTYSDSHFTQKGPDAFDCVGYTEFVYEQAGLNPTDNSYETGWGWPLTPWEQFEATASNAARGAAFLPPFKNGAGQARTEALLERGLFGTSAETPAVEVSSPSVN